MSPRLFITGARGVLGGRSCYSILTKKKTCAIHSFVNEWLGRVGMLSLIFCFILNVEIHRLLLRKKAAMALSLKPIGGRGWKTRWNSFPLTKCLNGIVNINLQRRHLPHQFHYGTLLLVLPTQVCLYLCDTEGPNLNGRQSIQTVNKQSVLSINYRYCLSCGNVEWISWMFAPEALPVVFN